MTRFVILTLIALLALPLAADQKSAWQALREGKAFLLLRHTAAPGAGDPEGFRLGDCSTQRNLSDRGRQEARRWGKLLVRRKVEQPRLYTSNWCRAQDTAQEMGLGAVETLSALDSFFSDPDSQAAQTVELRKAIDKVPKDRPVVMVSHQVNIKALTGVEPRNGEGLIIELPLAEPPKVLARIRQP
ncbi:histidine phosphatase family protein [Pseudomonas resinovorans]|uniref:Histidine phosphatase family protein n=1 Tax=Metapseudomonas resinovorans TaxID=53412 RepID=A0ABT4YBF0_METRE|nr:histidine phosphatase family protein [Pseudomonas resinovorans]MDA8485949.1 histidine phosphatase family protein [Pseudomonas resinovorans]